MSTNSCLIIFISLLVLVCTCSAIPVSVMLPLTVMNNDGYIQDAAKLKSHLLFLKSAGVDGVMVDVWWGLVEKTPKSYNFAGYLHLAAMCKEVGLTLQAVMSFHQCGTNVGDECFIPLPRWVVDVGSRNKSIWYTDQTGAIDEEYLSLGCDFAPIFQGRNPITIYSDFMMAFKIAFASYIPHVLNEIQVGMGPAGELRYPGYQLQFNRWNYCGVGAFQNYDAFMLNSLSTAANAAGHPEWASGGPANAGYYNSLPFNTPFYQDDGFDNYASPYGRFFLNWYSQQLVNHGSVILDRARAIFGHSVSLAAKISGIHWWYNSANHGAELTSGYYNTNGNDAYLTFAKMFSRTNTTFCFTCLEMTNSGDCASAPVNLVHQTILAAQTVRVPYSGENAMELCKSNCNSFGFDQIVSQARRVDHMHRFTYLRLTDNLLTPHNSRIFSTFVSQMKSLN